MTPEKIINSVSQSFWGISERDAGKKMHSISREWRGLEMSSGILRKREKNVRCWMSGFDIKWVSTLSEPVFALSRARAAIFISPRSKFRSNKSVEFRSLHKERKISRRSERAGRCLLLLHAKIWKTRERTRAAASTTLLFSECWKLNR